MFNSAYCLSLSAMLFVLMSLTYYKQKKLILYISGFFYIIFTVSATLIIWSPLSGTAAIFILLLTIVLPGMALSVFLIDYLFAVFCLEMRYLTLLWWLLTPMAIPLNFLGLML